MQALTKIVKAKYLWCISTDYCTLPCSTAPHRIVLHQTVPYGTEQYRTVPCSTVPCRNRLQSHEKISLSKQLQLWNRNLTWKADDADEPVSILVIDGHHHEVLVEEIHLLRPLARAIVALLRLGEAGIVLDGVVLVGLVLAGVLFGEVCVEVRVENVRLFHDGVFFLVPQGLQVPVTEQNGLNSRGGIRYTITLPC
jgi:hypothetical protein